MAEKKELRVRTLDISKARNIEFLWKERLVQGKLNLLVGNEGVGKSTLIAWIASQLTRGKLAGCLYEKPSKVGIVGDEDDFYDVWGPRIHVSNGVLERVVQIEHRNHRQVNVLGNINEIQDIVTTERIKLLYFDQFLDNLGISVDSYKTAEVRDAVAPLRQIAQNLNVTVVITLHPNKKRTDSFRELVQASGAFNALSRSSLYIAEHPDQEDLRVVAQAKSNYGAKAEALEFKLIPDSVRVKSRVLHTSRAISFEPCSLSLDELMAISPSNKRKGVRDTKTRECEKYILSLMADKQWHEASEIFEACSDRGYLTRMVRRAKDNLKLEWKRNHEFHAGVVWRVPGPRPVE